MQTQTFVAVRRSGCTNGFSTILCRNGIEVSFWNVCWSLVMYSTGWIGVSFWTKNPPGRHNLVPNVSCAAEIWSSTLVLARSPSGISGNAVTESGPWHFNASFRRRCHVSNAPLAWGWCTVVWIHWIPRNGDTHTHTHTHTHARVTSPPRADPNFITYFVGKSGPAIFKWSAICRQSADWNVWDLWPRTDSQLCLNYKVCANSSLSWCISTRMW